MAPAYTIEDHAILKLTPQEKTAYSYLFNLADSDSLGVVTGERAVHFFEKTAVPAPVLGEIWQIADTENRGLLTKPGFSMVLRLIGWYQNGQQQPSTDLAFRPAPLPKFDGITLPGANSAPAAASPTTGAFSQAALQPQLSGQSTGAGPIRIPPLDPAKVQQYSGLFERSGAQNGLLDGGTAKSIFEKAGLPNEVLGKIWMLSDREQRGALDQTEFTVAMHLLTSMKTRTMTALPNTLPSGLYEAAARRGARPPSRQMSVQQGAQGAIPRQFTGSSAGAPPRTQSPLARPPGYSTPPPQSVQTTGTPWLVTQQEKGRYDRFFSTIDTSGKGVLTGEQAVRFFSDSRLPEDTLASIWDLADINSEGQLNRDEFAVAMYLIGQQRVPNPSALPAFLPTALVPPNMRGQQQSQQSTAPAFDNANNTSNLPKSASEDLFGLDSSPTQPQFQQQSVLQPQGTGTSATRDPFGGSQPSSPVSSQRFQPAQPSGGSVFKQFMPTSAFGASLQSQNTGTSTTSSQGQARGFSQQQQAPRAPVPNAMDDLLGDNDAHAEESSKLTNETTELANMSNQIGNLRTQMEGTQSKKTATQADLNATSTQKQQLEQRLQQFRAQYETEVRSVKEMEQQLATSRESTTKLNQDMAMLEGTYQDLQTQHNTVSQQLQADQQENASLKQRISQINTEVGRLKPEIEKMKLDARQQKGLVSINKKQLATNDSERDRLQSEKTDLERDTAEQARSAAASPVPAIASQASNVVSPAASTMSSTNPFFRKASAGGGSALASPAAPASSGPTPSAFDTLFGPSEAFAPKGPAESGTGSPPATSFIGRSMPSAGTAVAAGAGAVGLGAAAAGGVVMADSMSSTGDPTPSATPPLSDRAKESPLETGSSAEPPPPPESRQFTPTNLPFGGGVVVGDGSDTVSSTMVVPPASRAGDVEKLREATSSPPPSSMPGAFSEPDEAEREIVPGAFPSDELQPTTSAKEVTPSDGPSTQSVTPAAKPNDDFDSAFASFGDGEKAKEADTTEDPFAPSSSQQPASQAGGFGSEFPPIQNLEHEDDSDSDSDDEPGRSFGDNFTASSLQRNDMLAPSAEPISATVASGDDIATARPTVKSIESTASDLPSFDDKQQPPPTYEQSGDFPHGGSRERTSSNHFPPEFGDLLPSREDPTSPPPPATSPPAQQTSTRSPMDYPEDEITPAPQPVEEQARPQNLMASQPSSATSQPLATPSTDVFVDAFSRPMSSVTAFTDSPSQTQTAPAADAPKSAFDEFDDFNGLSEAKEADKSGSDLDFSFGRQSADEFNPAFDSPAPSQSATPMARSAQPSQDGNGFANFTPNVSTSSTSPLGSGGGSIQQTPQNVQHDWDAIFSGLDSNKNVDTSFGNSDDPWEPAPATNGDAAKETTPTLTLPPPITTSKPQMPELGRAITPGTEHDDPILKRLTTMGYARSDALNALEMYDYDINKVSNVRCFLRE